MLIDDPTLVKDLRAGVCNPAELERYLLNHYPATVLAHELAQEIIESVVSKPIVLTKEQLMAHIRIQGFRWQDGELVPEGRGRYANKEK